MAKAPSTPYVDHLLTMADELVLHRGGSAWQQACLRRAVSSAYYAVFHALCTVCADGLVGWNRTELVREVYRALDHATARKK